MYPAPSRRTPQDHEEVAPYLKYVIQWETPVSSQIATRDLGRMLFQLLKKVKVEGSWPERIATVTETDAYWDIREPVQLYKKALEPIPWLEGMFLLSVDDHVQSDPYKSHAHQAFDGWMMYSSWFQINPDPEYIREVDPSLADVTMFMPYTEPHTFPDWKDLRSYCIPEAVKDEVYQIAAVHQMADRVYARSALRYLFMYFTFV